MQMLDLDGRDGRVEGGVKDEKKRSILKILSLH